MARDIPVGNGDLLITFDTLYRVRDIYFPHVGFSNHTAGHVQRFGVWVDGRLSWIEDDGWQRELRYKPDTLVTDVRLVNESLGIELTCHDAVDFHEPVYFRLCHIRDLTGKPRDVRLFFHLDPSIRGSAVGDTANYDPNTSSVIVYRDDIYFLINASDAHKAGVDHWAIGTKRVGGAEGTWRDAEDGQLGRNAISQGSVDCTVGLHAHVPAHGETKVTIWIAFGSSYQDVKALNKKLLDTGVERMLARTEAYWRLWARKAPIDLSPLPEPIRDLFYRSQLIMRTQIDNGGAILAANDNDVTAYGGDHYSYCWMRDGALVAQALILAGHGELSRSFFRFCAGCIERDGYFLHKYTPTGKLASSWHPWMLQGQRILPIQQDETSLVLWALRKHFEEFQDVEFIKPLYVPLVIRPAQWMLEYRDHNGLPLPSWDLWEERRGIHTFTVASTIAALHAAAAFARDFGELDRAAGFSEAAERMKGSLRRHAWHPEQKRFARMLTPLEDGTYRLDMTADSANYALWAFGAFSPTDPMVVSDMQGLKDRVQVKTDIGGYARYQRDYFHQVERQRVEDVPGNPWVICTLWHAMHAIAKARTTEELKQALPFLTWSSGRSRPSGVLAEQFNPYTGDIIGVSPLTWSHATFVTVVIEYARKHQLLRSLEPAKTQSATTP